MVVLMWCRSPRVLEDRYLKSPYPESEHCPQALGGSFLMAQPAELSPAAQSLKSRLMAQWAMIQALQPLRNMILEAKRVCGTESYAREVTMKTKVEVRW